MKIFMTLTLVCLSTSAFAGILDGKSYCRTVVSSGSFGQPAGSRQNCISFAANIATDNSNTFFGNPPERNPYLVNGQVVKFGKSTFHLSVGQDSLTSVTGSTIAGTVFELKK